MPRDWKQINLSKDDSKARRVSKKLCYPGSKYISNPKMAGRLAQRCLTVVRAVPLLMHEVDGLIFYVVQKECFISRTATQAFVTVGLRR